MPRRPTGPRLRLQPAEYDAKGGIVRHAAWVIGDGKRTVRTGCREGEVEAAQRKLADYILAKHEPARARDRDADQIDVADVIAVYSEDVAKGHARPKEALARLERLNEHFGAMKLSAITGAACRAYVAKKGAKGGARRELEDLRAAVKHYHAEGFVTNPPVVRLPDRGAPRERWLTRDEAAQLLWAAWRLRQVYRGEATRRATAKHIARFILVALYTGTRAGAVCGAAIRPTIGRGYVDLESGLFYRRPPGQRETKKRQPTIPLPDRLLAHLRRWEARGLSKATVVEWRGQPVTKINKAFRAVRTAAGFGADVVPHTLRHTAATWTMQAGADPWAASALLGMSLETLTRVYSHHHPDHLNEVKNAIATHRPDRKRASSGSQLRA